jgi:hypothetical protein
MGKVIQSKTAWRERIVKTTHWFLLPLRLVERACEWFSKLLGRWALLEIMGHLGRLAILVAVIFWFTESNERRKAKHYQAWQVINSADGRKSSVVRIDALQDLANDKASLAGIDISNANLQGINLRNAILTDANLSRAILWRAKLSGAYLRGADLSGAELTVAKLSEAKLYGADLSGAKLTGVNLSGANLRRADLSWANLYMANLSGADLSGADLCGANLRGVKRWRQIKSIKLANIYAVKNPPEGFIEWAKENGVVEFENDEEWEKYVEKEGLRTLRGIRKGNLSVVD